MIITKALKKLARFFRIIKGPYHKYDGKQSFRVNEETGTITMLGMVPLGFTERVAEAFRSLVGRSSQPTVKVTYQSQPEMIFTRKDEGMKPLRDKKTANVFSTKENRERVLARRKKSKQNCKRGKKK